MDNEIQFGLTNYDAPQSIVDAWIKANIDFPQTNLGISVASRHATLTNGLQVAHIKRSRLTEEQLTVVYEAMLDAKGPYHLTRIAAIIPEERMIDLWFGIRYSLIRFLKTMEEPSRNIPSAKYEQLFQYYNAAQTFLTGDEAKQLSKEYKEAFRNNATALDDIKYLPVFHKLATGYLNATGTVAIPFELRAYLVADDLETLFESKVNFLKACAFLEKNGYPHEEELMQEVSAFDFDAAIN